MEVDNEEISNGGGFWNPKYLEQNDSNGSGGNNNNNNDNNNSQGIQWNQNFLDSQPNVAASQVNSNFNMKRRKSSIIITPPSRTANTNPFQNKNIISDGNYNNSYIRNYDTTRRGSIAGYNYSHVSNNSVRFPQQQLAPQQQQQSYYNQPPLGGYSLQKNLHRSKVKGFIDPNDLQRRQSVATVNYDTKQHINNINPNTGKPSVQNLHGSFNFRRRQSAYPIFNDSFAYNNSSGGNKKFSIQKNDPINLIPTMFNVQSKSDLKPTLNILKDDTRRASINSQKISPLHALTSGLVTTYSLCSPDFQYNLSKNPKRVLTKPSEPAYNNGFDNVNSDLILYVNSILGGENNNEINNTKYLVLDVLGQGTFGQVVKCQNITTKALVAIKVIKSKSEYVNQSISEVRYLELINKKIDPENKHHFLRLFDTFIHKNHLCLVFELLSNNLYELLKQNQFHGLNIRLIKILTKQLLDSLTILKMNKLVHCDLKPENISLISPDKPDIKIIDFGSSCEETRTLYTYIQSRFYRAPEIMLGLPYSSSIDMWSLGCIVAELFLGIPIFPGASEFNQLTRIVNTLGYPPTWMLLKGKNTNKYLINRVSSSNVNDGNPNNTVTQVNNFELKTVNEFNLEYNASEKPSKRYFKYDSLDDIIRHYRIPRTIQGRPDLLEAELKERECLIHFLHGLLNQNPFERFTPQEALMHPFITGDAFNNK
ncbi:hypothetical protein TPHA_0A04570 [Tetrapisispora phaffii CBS 4417]|uniref:Protein kinase domain-containing protein n=1 Tax=Tetrapisispora phaffii (strain ATCC 24235 / CBS 4417 / NBRC 1672 / NRRL Y-8282 / UCD 70-5) TaxID=1071381 RepID=G8BNQ2_TETPH|nr:hypothetical protein TPHA_0A04570 [Tetrapisispora phaffii CBS 4417]CCE61530.1 hypothetical protein TPHA_0A04570 [Tetrapisispora phaffii CBS 4417]